VLWLDSGCSDDQAEQAGGKIFTFGSYRCASMLFWRCTLIFLYSSLQAWCSWSFLGYRYPGCLSSTSDTGRFLRDFCKHAARMERMHRIDGRWRRAPVHTSLTESLSQPVTEAYVPIIKAVISGIDIDFAFAKIARDRVSSLHSTQDIC
jgi:poly(A) polymerase Pap1